MQSPTVADLDRWSHATLEAARRRADPPADEAVATIDDPERVNRLLRGLVFNDALPDEGLPEEIRAYFERSRRLPDGRDLLETVDWAVVERGQRFFTSWGPQICMSLLCAALPASYAGGKQAKVLHYTGMLQNDVKRRIAETAQFVVEVMEPGSLAPGSATGKGLTTIRKVRLMHAFVRRRMAHDRETRPAIWDPAWGEPINQEDMAAGLLCFAVIPLLALTKLGATYADADAEAYLYTWTVIGRLLGIEEGLLPADLRAARALSLRIKFRHFEASTEGKALAAALVEMCQELTPDPLDSVPEQMIVYLLGRRTAALLGLRTGPFNSLLRAIVWLTAPIMRLRSRLTAVARRLSPRVLSVAIRRIASMAGFRAAFALPGRVIGSLDRGRRAAVRHINECCGLTGERLTQSPRWPRERAMIERSERDGAEILLVLPSISRKGWRAPFAVPEGLVGTGRPAGAARIARAREHFDTLAAKRLVPQTSIPANGVPVNGNSVSGHVLLAGPDWSAALEAEHVLLAHWPLPPDAPPDIPDSLTVATYGGTPWLTVAAMRIAQVQMTDPLPVRRAAPGDDRSIARLNLAAVACFTYVDGDAGPGVYVLGIDVSDYEIDRAARERLGVPTTYQDVVTGPEHGWTTVRSRHVEPDGAAEDARFACRYRRTGRRPLAVEPESFDAFLERRDRLYVQGADGELYDARLVVGGVEQYAAEARFGGRVRLPGVPATPPSLVRYLPQTELAVGRLPAVLAAVAAGGRAQP